MAPRKFVILKNRDLAITNGSTGLTRISFTKDDVSPTQTVTFDTTNPCVAVVDNENIQWDLNSKRVWYSDTQVTIDITDILFAKGMITEPAKFTTLAGTYERARANDTESGYSWRLISRVPGSTEVTPYLYTKTESPSVGDKAYYSDTTTGASTNIQTVTAAIAEAIEGSWDAVFTVSNVQGSGSTISGIVYTPV